MQAGLKQTLHRTRPAAGDAAQRARWTANFGPNAALHLRRNDGFLDAPDIYVNSFFDPETKEGAAFEEQIGFHGGMGGSQTQPFVLFPSELPLTDEPLIGAEAVYRLLNGWVTTPEQQQGAKQPQP